MISNYKRYAAQSKMIRRHTTKAQSYSCGIGWIAVPSGVTRAEYVQTVLRTGMVNIITKDGAIINQAHIDKSILNLIKFPASYQELGSAIVWLNIPVMNRYVIINMLQSPEGGSIYEETEYEYGRTDLLGSSLINGNGASGRLLLSTHRAGGGSVVEISATDTQSQEDNSGSSLLLLKVTGTLKEQIRGTKQTAVTNGTTLQIKNGQEDSIKTTITADRGSVNVSIVDDEDNVVELKYVKDEGLSYKDQYENEIIANETNIQIKAKEAVNLGDGAEPIVLGDTLKSTLEDLISAIKTITVPTAMGPSGTPINFAQFDAINTTLSSILSQYSSSD